MCISDWSSDVCSSDLDEVQACAVGAEPGVGLDARGRGDRSRRGRRPGSGQAAAPHQLPSGEVAVAANEPEVVRARIAGGMRFPCMAGDTGHVPAPDVVAGSRQGACCRQQGGCQDTADVPPRMLTNGRTEEHTSELQSLMRISYAVLCLEKK